MQKRNKENPPKNRETKWQRGNARTHEVNNKQKADTKGKPHQNLAVEVKKKSGVKIKFPPADIAAFLMLPTGRKN